MDWLLSVVRFLFDLFPRPRVVTTDQRRVAFWLGRWPIVRGPGVYLEWPVLSVYETVQISEEVIRSEVVKNGIKRCWMARFKVVDPLLWITVATSGGESTRAAIDGMVVEFGDDPDVAAINDVVGEWGCQVVDFKFCATGIFTIDVNGSREIEQVVE